MKQTVDDRKILCAVAIVCGIVILVGGLAMEYGWFGYGYAEGVPVVPVSVTPTEVIASEAVQQEAKVNINTATVTQLEALPGIGEVIANRIVDFRNENGAFASVEDLLAVKGIGETTLEKLKPHIVIE